MAVHRNGERFEAEGEGTAPEHASVVIVGGGGVGLSAALFLARQGIRPLLLERRATTSPYPRATGLAPRTRELLREAGLEERVLAAGSRMARSGGKIIVKQLAGTDLGAVERISPVSDDGSNVVASVSPIAGAGGVCPQDVLEPILLDAARAEGAAVRFGTEAVDLRQDERQVTLTVRDTSSGATSDITADYVIAADGADSPVRERLGITSSGPGPLGAPMLTVLFRADLSELVRGHEFVVCEIRDPEAEGLLLAVNNIDRWVFYLSCPPGGDRGTESLPPARCAEIVRKAIGVPDLDVEVLAVTPWQAAASVADEVQKGRVFLVGDSAHVMPPSGAYGLNTGIADAHNLAWKLAYTLRGLAGEALVDTYEQERLPVGRFTADQAMLVQRNPRLHWDLRSFAAERERLGMAHPVVVSLCPQYDSRAVATPRGRTITLTDPAADLDGHPGSRAPHLWVESPSGERVSTLDVCGDGFVLLYGRNGDDWRSAAEQAFVRLGVPLTAYHIAPDGGELTDIHDKWPDTTGVQPGGALLVRPDGYVAWRADSTVAEAAAELEGVLRRILGREEA